MKNIKKWKWVKIICGTGLAVICVCIGILIGKGDLLDPSGTGSSYTKGAVNTQVTEASENEDNTEDKKAREAANQEIYEKLYQHMKGNQPDYNTNRTDSVIMEDVAEEEAAEVPMDDAPAVDFAGTNLQVEFVDEADIVKNDGRYLYQFLRDDSYKYSAVQIIDTEDDLQEVSRISDFSNIQEFYVWEDTMVVIERLWAESLSEEEQYVSEGLYGGNPFSKLHFYDISDRSAPKEIHTFTLRGEYRTSRISEGYLYFFSAYYINEPVEKENPKSYIPMVEGRILEYDCLYLPEKGTAASYLLMVSVDLSDPTTFTDKMAVVSNGNDYYVSEKNIYVLETIQTDYEQDGIQCDKTQIVRFAYEDGQIESGAEGCVDGLMLDQFSMDEYKDHFRIITTVSGVKVEEVIDDFSGEIIGYTITEELPTTNSVYVLDQSLNITGAITGLAEEERVYSARFMGDMGYFVTFRQVDPLFSVDFSDLTRPKILGELKITGFSEYLHFYGKDKLVGIGYEADPETGITKGIKLSMFDISNPVDAEEIHKLVMEEYDHADAFYTHHAVLVSESKNVIGFLTEGYTDHHMRDYGVYSYEQDDGFNQRFLVDCIPGDHEYFEVRGTYIGNVFYILQQNGGVQAYNIQTGELLDALEIE